MKIYRVLLWAFVVCILCTSPVSAETVDRIVAVVDDDVITQSELTRAFAPYAESIEQSFKGADLEEALRIVLRGS